MAEQDDLLRVCSLLNEQGVKYLVAGGHACILHGIVRATEDVDILIDASEENCKRVLAALGQLKDGAARQLSAQDLMDNVVKIADEVQVDVSIHAWKVSYEDAIASAREVTVEGVRIPFLGLDCLIASKETYREKDAFDLAHLRLLKHRQQRPT
jgi:hypothetical protein